MYFAGYTCGGAEDVVLLETFRVRFINISEGIPERVFSEELASATEPAHEAVLPSDQLPVRPMRPADAQGHLHHPAFRHILCTAPQVAPQCMRCLVRRHSRQRFISNGAEEFEISIPVPGHARKMISISQII